MKAKELIDGLCEGARPRERTCDTVKSGDPEKTVKKVGVTMVATVDVIKQATAWGADMLIVHEPTYYDHMDVIRETPVTLAKQKLINDSGMVIFRYHDKMHGRYDEDLINKGELEYLGLCGKMYHSQTNGMTVLESDTPISARELASRMKNEFGIPHVRCAGQLDKKFTKIGLFFGAGSNVSARDLLADEADIIIAGEISEWQVSEYARDADQLGMDKAVIVMGHIASEAGGMIMLAKDLSEKYTDLDVRYFECGAVYKEL